MPALTLLAAALLAAPVSAAGGGIYELGLDELGEVVITDSKAPQARSAVTQQVQVLTAAALETLPAPNRNLSEFLKYQPGQFVSVLSRNDANWGSYGGLGPKYNGYLLDGLPFDSFTGGMELDPWALERVEMYNGPAAVMYPDYLNMDFAGGATPLSGVTNFILKERIETGLTRFQAAAGSYNTVSGKFYTQGASGDLHYLLGAGAESSDYTDYGAPGSWLGILEKPSYTKSRLYGKFTRLLGSEDHKVSFFAGQTLHAGFAGRPNRDFRHDYSTLNAAYSRQLGADTGLAVKAGYRGYERRWGEDNYPVLSLREHDGVVQRVLPLDAAVNFSHSGESMLTAGTDFQAASYKTYAEAGGLRTTGNFVTARQAGVYLQEKMIVGAWVLRAGARLSYIRHSYDVIGSSNPDSDGKSWKKPRWSLGARYQAAERLALYANAGSSFLPPSAKAYGGTLHASDAGVAGRSGQLPNPGLRPEEGLSADAGVDYLPGEGTTVGARAFITEVRDAIVDNVVSASPSQTKAFNAGELRSRGLQVYAARSGAGGFGVFANATFTDSEVRDALNPDQNGTEIPFVPDFVANAGLTAPLPWKSAVSIYAQSAGEYFDSASRSSRTGFGRHTVVNCRAVAALSGESRQALNLTLDLNNITNERYSMPWQFRDPGFNAMASLELRF